MNVADNTVYHLTFFCKCVNYGYNTMPADKQPNAAWEYTYVYTTPEEGSWGYPYNLDLFLQITHPALDYQ